MPAGSFMASPKDKKRAKGNRLIVSNSSEMPRRWFSNMQMPHIIFVLFPFASVPRPGPVRYQSGWLV